MMRSQAPLRIRFLVQILTFRRKIPFYYLKFYELLLFALPNCILQTIPLNWPRQENIHP
jgi:hypothetical protein